MIYFKLFLGVLSFVILVSHYIYRRYLTKSGSSFIMNLSHKRDGIYCYSCNTMIITDTNEAIAKIMSGSGKLTLCKSCQRDIKLSSLLFNASGVFIKLKKWILSKNSETVMLSFIILPLVAMVTTCLLVPSMYDSAALFNNISQAFYWSIMTYRIWLCRKN